jgi:heme-degrading monooxygenase HmoA
MIVVSEQFFVAPECREAFDAWCERLFHLMAMRPGCCHAVLSRPAKGLPSHVLHSAWESPEAFRAWTRSDAFVLAASGTLPEGSSAFVAPKRMAVEVIDHRPVSSGARGDGFPILGEAWAACGESRCARGGMGFRVVR